MKEKKQAIILKVSEGDGNVAYLQLPKHPKKLVHGIVKKTVSLYDLMGSYKGSSIYLDFDEDDELIGIEILE